MSYHGDIRLGDTIDVKFSTVGTTGAPTTLAGTPSVAAYVGNGTTEITAGITLTVDFDARTGLHNVRVVATSGNGFATQTNVDLVITAGTVGGTSVVGYVIGSFSIENRVFSAVGNEAIADALLNRNVSGGSNSGRLVKQALHFLRNKWDVVAGTLTVYDTDDTTQSWTAAVTSTAGADPVTGNDPS